MQVWGWETGPRAGRKNRPAPPHCRLIAPYSPYYNQGGLVGSDETVALTAFVVIALHHGLSGLPRQDFRAVEEVVKQL